MGVQIAHPDALVIDIAGDASVQMTMQEISTAVQYELPIKIFILNNEWMGMVRQWQQLLHGERYSHSYSESLPDFVKLAEAYGAVGIRCEDPAELDAKIMQMIDTPRPVIFDGERMFGHRRLIECQTGRAAAVEVDARAEQKQHGRDDDERHRGRGDPLEDTIHQIFTRFSGAM